MDPETETTASTREADARDAAAAHQPDRPPTPDEERAAEKNDLDPSTREAYEHMAKLGANVEGEGKIGG